MSRQGEKPPEVISVKSAGLLAYPGEVLSFLEVQARARCEAEAAIGYIPSASGETVWPFLEADGGHRGQSDALPLRQRKRAWVPGDRLVVIETAYSD